MPDRMGDAGPAAMADDPDRPRDVQGSRPGGACSAGTAVSSGAATTRRPVSQPKAVSGP
jgi:hypothetical protein